MALTSYASTINGAQLAGAAWLLAADTITMSSTKPTAVAAGDLVIDISATPPVLVGIISGWASTTLTLTAPALVASGGANDMLAFVEPVGTGLEWSAVSIAADLADLNLILAALRARVEHGVLYYPDRLAAIKLAAGDTIIADATNKRLVITTGVAGLANTG